MTPAMIKHADAVNALLEANPDVVEMYEKWHKMSREEKLKMANEYYDIYQSMPNSTPDEEIAKDLFFYKNYYIIRYY